jgi:chemotaxis protein CheC
VNPLFGPREVDALQELASIGCGQALTALGKLCNRRMEMDVPEAWVGAETGAIADFLGALGQDILAVGVKLEGRLEGDLLLALPQRDAERLAQVLGFPVDQQAGWGGMAESALLESGNIVGSAFVSAVAALVEEKLLLSVPSLARGSGKACVERLVSHRGSVALATRFSCEGIVPGAGLEGLILVMPDPERIAGLVGYLLAEQGD